MSPSAGMPRRGAILLAALVAMTATIVASHAQHKTPAPGPAAATPGAEAVTSQSATKGTRMERLSGVWVEGPGFDITYGGTYDGCASRCLAHAKCLMIEYYRPEKKCNLYDRERPRLKGGSSIVGLRR